MDGTAARVLLPLLTLAALGAAIWWWTPPAAERPAPAATLALPPGPPDATTRMVEALKAVRVEAMSWRLGGFGAVLIVDLTVVNGSRWPVRDLGIACTTYGASGTRLSRVATTLYERLAPGTSRRFEKVNFGIVHPQSARAACRLALLAADPAPGGRMASGTTATTVVTVQRHLLRLGFDPGPADGIAGARTRAAISAWQRARGRAETGAITPDLVADLAAELARRN